MMDSSLQNPYAEIGITDTIAPWTSLRSMILSEKQQKNRLCCLRIKKCFSPLLKNKLNLSQWLVRRRLSYIWLVFRDTALQDKYFTGIRMLPVRYLCQICPQQQSRFCCYCRKQCDVAIVCIGNHPLSHGLAGDKTMFRAMVVKYRQTGNYNGTGRPGQTVMAANPKTYL